ncbi:hypothetical protein HanRHA438_Chr14g0660031 [Helianthus annuus]|nr:hypothetical protein HanRHA438_Chr14g0660031 [Helianthus annuus]
MDISGVGFDSPEKSTPPRLNGDCETNLKSKLLCASKGGVYGALLSNWKPVDKKVDWLELMFDSTTP